MLEKIIIATAAILAAGVGAALAHISLAGREAPVGSTYKAVFQVPHGCEGRPTQAVRVRIPEGFIAVKPQPKPGWQLEKIRGDYARSYEYHGAQVGEGVTEIIWSGGSLADDEYDEFVLRGFLTTSLEPGGTLHFPVVQECADGLAERWIEIPADGQPADGLEQPAPGVKLLERAGGH